MLARLFEGHTEWPKKAFNTVSVTGWCQLTSSDWLQRWQL